MIKLLLQLLLIYCYCHHITNNTNSNTDTINFGIGIIWETGVQSQVVIPPPKKILDAILLHTQHYKVWSNPGKGVLLSPTPPCSSYWKLSLWVCLFPDCYHYQFFY